MSSPISLPNASYLGTRRFDRSAGRASTARDGGCGGPARTGDRRARRGHLDPDAAAARGPAAAQPGPDQPGPARPDAQAARAEPAVPGADDARTCAPGTPRTRTGIPRRRAAAHVMRAGARTARRGAGRAAGARAGPAGSGRRGGDVAERRRVGRGGGRRRDRVARGRPSDQRDELVGPAADRLRRGGLEVALDPDHARHRVGRGERLAVELERQAGDVGGMARLAVRGSTSRTSSPSGPRLVADGEVDAVPDVGRGLTPGRHDEGALEDCPRWRG